MKRVFVFLLLMISFVCSNSIFAQTAKVKADSEIIREFKSMIKNGEFLDFPDKALALKPIKAETLEMHKIYKELIDIIKNPDVNSLAREVAVELLLYFKAESHKILNLETELVNLLQSDTSGWYIKSVIIRELPNAISADDTINMNKFRAALKTLLNKKSMNDEENKKLINQKRSVIGVLEKVGIPYSEVKNVIEPIMHDVKSELKTSAIEFLTEYSVSHKDFNDPEIKRCCTSIFKNSTNDYSEIEVADTIKLYANLISNEENFHLQGSDEEIFLKFLKNENDLIIIASAKALSKVKAMSSVEKVVERLKEMASKNEEVRNALIDALIYMEANLIYSKSELSPSKKKEALVLIRDTFITILSSEGVRKILPLQAKLLYGLNFFVVDIDATEYINLDTIKKIITLLPVTTDEEIKGKIGKLLGNLTSEGYGTDVDMWVRWVKNEERKPNSKFLK